MPRLTKGKRLKVVNQVKMQFIINRTLKVLPTLQDCTFDSVELLPDPDDIGDFIRFNLWVRNAKDEKVVGHSEDLEMSITF